MALPVVQVYIIIYDSINSYDMIYRAVARYLHTEFVARKKRGEDEVVKLSQVVEGKSKKRNARMFYELLVRRFFRLVLLHNHCFCDSDCYVLLPKSLFASK